MTFIPGLNDLQKTISLHQRTVGTCGRAVYKMRQKFAQLRYGRVRLFVPQVAAKENQVGLLMFDDGVHGGKGSFVVVDGLMQVGEAADLEASIRAEFQILKNEKGIINLKTRVYEEDIFRFEENIYEILHDPQVICELLQKVGFRVLQCADRLCPEENGSTTWYIIAAK